MWLHGPWEATFPLMWIFPLIFVVVMLVFIFRATGGSRGSGGGSGDRQDSAREILDQRYARGEVSRDDYLRMRKDIE